MKHDKRVTDWSCAAVSIALCAVVGCANPADGGVVAWPDSAPAPASPDGGVDKADIVAPGYTPPDGGSLAGDVAPGFMSPDGGPVAGDVGGGGSALPFIQARADLADGTTSAGQGPFKVSYWSLGGVLDDTRLGQLSAQLSLRTWPEGIIVSTAVTIGPVTPSNDNLPATTVIVEIAPSSPLDDRWYSLQLGPAEQGIVTSQAFDGGVPGIRLRPGSHPAVRVIEFCKANDPGSKFIVAFSEPVTAGSPAEMFTLTQSGATLSCRFDALMPQDLHEFCATLVPGPLTVTLAVGKAQSAGGVPVAAGSWSFDTRNLPAVESGCVGYLVGL